MERVSRKLCGGLDCGCVVLGLCGRSDERAPCFISRRRRGGGDVH
jgi:hypothetical protein